MMRVVVCLAFSPAGRRWPEGSDEGDFRDIATLQSMCGVRDYPCSPSYALRAPSPRGEKEVHR